MLHVIAEKLMLRAAEKPLPAWQRRWLVSHLGSCRRCRDQALGLACFLHEEDPRPALNAWEKEVLRQGIMEKLHQKDEASRMPRPLVSRRFVVSLAAAAAAAGLVTLLSIPPKEQVPPGGGHDLSAPGRNLLVIPTQTPRPEATATPTATPTAAVTATLTPLPDPAGPASSSPQTPGAQNP